VIWWLAIGVLASGFDNIGIVALRKELEFQREFWFRITKKVITIMVTLSCALALRSYWALVIGMVCSRILGVGLSYVFHPYRPRLSLTEARSFVGFSKWLLLGSVLGVLRTRGAHLLVGRFAGAEALGLYTISFEVSNLPTTELSAPINRAVFPGYSKLASDRNALRSNFLKVFSTIVVITMPAAVGISLLAEPLVLTLLGPNWAGAVPLVRMLALFGLVSSAMNNLFYVFLVCGMPYYNTAWSASLLAIQLPLVAAGCLEFGIQGAATGALIGASVPLPFVLHRASRVLGIDARAWVRALWRPAMATLAMALAVLAVKSVAAPYVPVLMLLVCIGIGTPVYAAALLVLWKASGRPDGAESFLVSACLSRFGARAAS
jgi:O-antigen/teichoic acid export membrane protein